MRYVNLIVQSVQVIPCEKVDDDDDTQQGKYSVADNNIILDVLIIVSCALLNTPYSTHLNEIVLDDFIMVGVSLAAAGAVYSTHLNEIVLDVLVVVGVCVAAAGAFD